VTVLSCDVTRHTRSLKQFCAQQIVALNLSAVKKKSINSSVFRKNELIVSKFILYYDENSFCQNMRVAGLISFYFIEIYRPKKTFLYNKGWNADNFVERMLQGERIHHGLCIRLKCSENTGRSIALECTRNTSRQNDSSIELSVYNEESKSGFPVKN
jgi:hypothetical protein